MTIPVRSATRAVAILALMGWAGPVLAETVESTVRHGRPAELFPVMTYGKNDCASYPVKDLKITVRPAHGKASFVTKKGKLGQDSGVCNGKSFEAAWLVYHPQPGYVGSDTISISWKWTLYDNGTYMKYATRDFAISVK